MSSLSDVQADWRNIKLIPDFERTEEMWISAITQNINSLFFITSDEMTPYIIKIILDTDWKQIQCVPSSKMSSKLLMYGIKKNWQIIFQMENDQITEEMYLEALNQNINSFYSFDLNRISEKVILEALAQNLDVFHILFSHQRTNIICEFIIEKNPAMIKFLTHEQQTKKIIESVLEKDDSLIQFISNSYFESEENCLTLIEKFKLSLSIFNDEIHLTQNMCIAAIRNDPEEIIYVPAKFQTPEIVQEVLAKDSRLAKWVRDAF